MAADMLKNPGEFACTFQTKGLLLSRLVLVPVTTMLVAHERECSEMYYVPYVYISIHDRSSLLQLPSLACLLVFRSRRTRPAQTAGGAKDEVQIAARGQPNTVTGEAAYAHFQSERIASSAKLSMNLTSQSVLGGTQCRNFGLKSLRIGRSVTCKSSHHHTFRVLFYFFKKKDGGIGS